MKTKDYLSLLFFSAVMIFSAYAVNYLQDKNLALQKENFNQALLISSYENQALTQTVEVNNDLYKPNTYDINSVISVEYQLYTKHLKSLCEEYQIDYKSFDFDCRDVMIDPNYAMAVFMLETGNGTHANWTQNNNPAGIKSNGTNCVNSTTNNYCIFESKEDGIAQMIFLMGKYANEYDLLTIDEQRKLWSESEDSESVVNIMNQIRAK